MLDTRARGRYSACSENAETLATMPHRIATVQRPFAGGLIVGFNC
jgi:hypothetical protein